MIARIIFALWILPAASLAWAHDGINNQWYESLRVPGSTSYCCSGHDCKPTEAELRGNRWWARRPDGQWIEVPDNLIIKNKGNPVGQPVLCLLPDYYGAPQVRCFVPGALI
jgi:hypothetical protein